MRKDLRNLVCVVILAIAVSIIGVNSAAALPADVQRDNICYVGYGEFEYVVDETCRAQSVFKLDDEGNFQFFIYQDHGQIPADMPPPSEAVRNSFELCLNFGGSIGIKCGIANEVVTPSGEYKSWLQIR